MDQAVWAPRVMLGHGLVCDCHGLRAVEGENSSKEKEKEKEKDKPEMSAVRGGARLVQPFC